MSGEIAIQAERHRSGRWITVPVLVGGIRSISAVLDTGAPVSGISPDVESSLLALGLLRSADQPNRYLLGDLTTHGQRLPSLNVAVIRRLERLRVDALLGLDFLNHFERIDFHTRLLQLILEEA